MKRVAHGLIFMDACLAIIFAALGYAEGGKLSAEMGAVNVISWALALTLPINILATYHLCGSGSILCSKQS